MIFSSALRLSSSSLFLFCVAGLGGGIPADPELGSGGGGRRAYAEPEEGKAERCYESVEDKLRLGFLILANVGRSSSSMRHVERVARIAPAGRFAGGRRRSCFSITLSLCRPIFSIMIG